MIKPILILISILSLGIGIAQACELEQACDLEFKQPLPQAADMVCNQTSQVITYTVKSNVPADVAIDEEVINLNPTLNDSFVAVTGGTCKGVVPAKGTCTIEVTITPAACSSANPFPQDMSWELVIIPDANNPDLIAPINLTVSGGVKFIVTAAGQDLTGNSPPLLAVHNVNDAWQTVAPPVDSGTFFSTTCGGTGSSATCIAAGQSDVDSSPLLYVSQDGGVTWNLANVTTGSLPSKGVFNGAGCTENGVLCAAVGENLVTNQVLYAMSVNNGASWSVTTLSTFAGSFSAAACSGTDSSSYTCSFVGQNNTDSTPIALIMSNNLPSPSYVDRSGDFPANSNLLATACADINNCTAVGQDITNGNLPLLYVNTAANNNTTGGAWTSITLAFTPPGVLYGTDCTLVSGSPLCTAVGNIVSGSPTAMYPVLFTSTGNLSSWTKQATNTNPGVFYDTACTNLASTGICTVVGENLQTAQSVPTLYISTNPNSGSWTTPFCLPECSPNCPPQCITLNNGVFLGTNCAIGTTPSAAQQVVCSVAGQLGSGITSSPLIYVNTDVTGTGTWSNQTIPSLPSFGCFFKVGSANSFSAEEFFNTASSCNTP